VAAFWGWFRSQELQAQLFWVFCALIAVVFVSLMLNEFETFLSRHRKTQMLVGAVSGGFFLHKIGAPDYVILVLGAAGWLVWASALSETLPVVLS
jgi:hypothetical protein